MKRFIYVILCVLLLLLSCEKESSSADYYVRYEMSTSSQYVKNSRKISVNTDSGVKEYNTDLNGFTETFGPFKKCFNANITVVYVSDYPGATTTLKIYVSRGQEPFALKAETVGGQKTVSASYIIDF